MEPVKLHVLYTDPLSRHSLLNHTNKREVEHRVTSCNIVEQRNLAYILNIMTPLTRKKAYMYVSALRFSKSLRNSNPVWAQTETCFAPFQHRFV